MVSSMLKAAFLVKSNNFMESLNQPLSMDPPLQERYKTLFANSTKELKSKTADNNNNNKDIIEECELPLIDLGRLISLDEKEKDGCKEEIARASKDWGFFQVINHAISREILEKLRCEQVKVFKQPFNKKHQSFSAGSYRWGTPTATCLRQLSWSEAFHIPLTDISNPAGLTNLSSTMVQFATTIAALAQNLAEILAEKLGCKSSFFEENCLPSSCYLRMNRYPPCPISSDAFGLTPHTDSDFLTILHQDQVGGLQLVKDGKWFAVKPNPDALIVNIGDLFQAWSNDVYKSVEHRVVTNPKVERFSTAYFLCPSYDTVVESFCEPSVYKKFSFREYRRQVQEDVQTMGYKVGLKRFVV
ncbi:gibberellin 2-beta-dioxygenase 8 isoform X2 [Tripterygium wilfordii]|nr:gibberellin 2-beta-dioxygenase 8 isoform X2 [Tripterygium wilfordii]